MPSLNFPTLTSSPSSFLHESSKLMCRVSTEVRRVVSVSDDKSTLDPCICILIESEACCSPMANCFAMSGFGTSCEALLFGLGRCTGEKKFIYLTHHTKTPSKFHSVYLKTLASNIVTLNKLCQRTVSYRFFGLLVITPIVNFKDNIFETKL